MKCTDKEFMLGARHENGTLCMKQARKRRSKQLSHVPAQTVGLLIIKRKDNIYKIIRI